MLSTHLNFNMSLEGKIHHEPGAGPTAEVWVVHAERRVLLTDMPGPPAACCGYVSAEAEAAAKARGHATVSELGFPSDCFVGSWLLPATGWGEAGAAAEAKARELGYEVECEPRFMDEREDGEW